MSTTSGPVASRQESLLSEKAPKMNRPVQTHLFHLGLVLLLSLLFRHSSFSLLLLFGDTLRPLEDDLRNERALHRRQRDLLSVHSSCL